MQILDKAVTPDGMEIELHDLLFWKARYYLYDKRKSEKNCNRFS